MKRAHTAVPGAVVVGLVLAVVLDTVIQISWKLAVAPVSGDASLAAIARRVFSSPLFGAVVLGFGAQLYNWLRVLARADLSFAQPFTALSFISVLAISSRSLHENISPAREFGVLLIFLGVFCISRTPFQTAHAGGRDPADSDPPRP